MAGSEPFGRTARLAPTRHSGSMATAQCTAGADSETRRVAGDVFEICRPAPTGHGSGDDDTRAEKGAVRAVPLARAAAHVRNQRAAQRQRRIANAGRQTLSERV